MRGRRTNGRIDRQTEGQKNGWMDEKHAPISGEERFYGDLMSPAKINVLTSSCIVSDSFVLF